jgi:hypothetical protein
MLLCTAAFAVAVFPLVYGLVPLLRHARLQAAARWWARISAVVVPIMVFAYLLSTALDMINCQRRSRTPDPVDIYIFLAVGVGWGVLSILLVLYARHRDRSSWVLVARLRVLDPRWFGLASLIVTFALGVAVAVVASSEVGYSFPRWYAYLGFIVLFVLFAIYSASVLIEAGGGKPGSEDSGDVPFSGR